MKARNRKLLTMHEAIFYRLYKANREAKAKGQAPELIPVHAFMGEIYCPELGKWGYVSHECSARASELWKKNVDPFTQQRLIYREDMTGKSGATFYGYRIHPKASASCITDPNLKAFYERLRARAAPVPLAYLSAAEASVK